MNITLVISSMRCGGAERVMSSIANYWADKGKDIALITLDSKINDFYTIDPRVKRFDLNLLCDSPNVISAFKNNFVRTYILRKTILASYPDIIISFIDRMNVLTLVATRGLSIPVVVSEHTDPRQLPPGGIWNFLRRWTYLWANAVVVLTEELRSVAAEFVPNNQLFVIPNAAVPVEAREMESVPIDMPSLSVVAMGRLMPVKGFDILLEAFAGCANNSSWSLVILGEGPEREKLESLAQKYGLEQRVLMPGRVKEPSAFLKRAKLFVLSSRYEGFPMALIEAMSNGLPVISFNCPTGPSDIIRDGVDGVLVPVCDVTALTKAMNRLMGDENERRRLADNAPSVLERLSVDKVMKLWDTLLHKITKNRLPCN